MKDSLSNGNAKVILHLKFIYGFFPVEDKMAAAKKCPCAVNTGNQNSTNILTHALVIIVVLCTTLLILVR